jgi:hypothetical protein
MVGCDSNFSKPGALTYVLCNILKKQLNVLGRQAGKFGLEYPGR